MANARRSRLGFAWLELLFAIALLALLLQLFPRIANALDFRTWSRTAWMAVNATIILTLVLIRYAPDQLNSWRDRHGREEGKKDALEKRRAAKEHRESLQRIRQSRKRRLY